MARKHIKANARLGVPSRALSESVSYGRGRWINRVK
jgi:hypothetical protein